MSLHIERPYCHDRAGYDQRTSLLLSSIILTEGLLDREADLRLRFGFAFQAREREYSREHDRSNILFGGEDRMLFISNATRDTAAYCAPPRHTTPGPRGAPIFPRIARLQLHSPSGVGPIVHPPLEHASPGGGGWWRVEAEAGACDPVWVEVEAGACNWWWRLSQAPGDG